MAANPIYLTLMTAFYLLSFLPTSPTGQNAGRGVFYDPDSNPSTCSTSQLDQIHAQEPACESRPTLVKLPAPETEQHVNGIHPKEVLVPRCGGDSTCSRNSRCIPRPGSKSSHTFSVQLIYHNGGTKCTSVTVETHSACECGCPISEQDCTDLQEFDANQCRCKCKADQAEIYACYTNSTKFWDPEQCRCKCKQQSKECSSTYFYDNEDTCECKPKPYLRVPSSSGRPPWGPSPSMASMTAMKVALGILSFITVAALAAAFTFWRKLSSERRQIRAQMSRMRKPSASAADQTQAAPLLDVPDQSSSLAASSEAAQQGNNTPPQV